MYFNGQLPESYAYASSSLLVRKHCSYSSSSATDLPVWIYSCEI